jgi:acyl carrier protein
MNEKELLATFTAILRDILADDDVSLEMETRREDVPKWDSFNYITFIAAVEMVLGVKFRIADVEGFEDVGAIVARTQAMLV